MADVYAMSFGVPGYSGLLFNKGVVETPLSSAIGGKAAITNHVEFVTGQEYTTGTASQPAISEEASLTAPDATVVTREQKTNVTQIFHESVAISYGKMSNMGTLSGINIENQFANPASELDFQVAAKMQKIANDIEYTFINGVYQKATSDAVANKTRGLVGAITENVEAAAGEKLTLKLVEQLIMDIYNANAPTNDLVLWVDALTAMQINNDAKTNGATIVPASREVNGIAIDTLVTPLGAVGIRVGRYLPAGTALLLNLGVIRPVFQPVPEKGNFFLEELAKTGAGSKYQIFGQVGLDHGPTFYHGKITGLNTDEA